MKEHIRLSGISRKRTIAIEYPFSASIRFLFPKRGGLIVKLLVDPTLQARLNTREPRQFANQVPFLEYLAEHGIDIFDRDMLRPFAEAGVWGATRHHGLVGNAVIVKSRVVRSVVMAGRRAIACRA